ncbi:hypothetical protein NIES37_38060 [Tolypothrix tenuis PCC 7101]|uniref:ARC6 IMS domain-containing protein n=2 Tax=Tolypothrix TaxID=111782 RepID=A0A1Z4N281_9CYAN|nr:hypothetical protein NIES37_38060 [Tolypothrix tenuis PCC 7101]BAZ76255.1 hypothetical protein NIES50_48530 [Aulosira laxa NIES-50]
MKINVISLGYQSSLYQVKKIIFMAIIFQMINSGCSGTSPKSAKNISNPQCPDKPESLLDSKNVKQLQLASQTLTETGQAKADQSLGYTFEAKSGQKLNYQTNDDICIWIYAPDNQLITSKDLSQTGKYIMQVSAPKGLRSFELKIGLDVSQALITSSSQSWQQNIETTDHPDTTNFVRNHYIALNDRQYAETWKHLSPSFKKLSGSYSEYQQWWNSVREIKIGDVKLINQNTDTAIVDAELWYFLNSGKSFKDSNNRIYLIWSNSSNSWLFERKSSP